MIYVIDVLHKQYRFDEDKIVLVEFWPDDPDLLAEVEADGLGARLRIALVSGAAYELRGKLAEFMWDAMSRDACWIKEL